MTSGFIDTHPKVRNGKQWNGGVRGMIGIGKHLTFHGASPKKLTLAVGITPYGTSMMSFAESTTMPPLLSAPLLLLDLTNSENTTMTQFAPSHTMMTIHPSMSTLAVGIMLPYGGTSMKIPYHDETPLPLNNTNPKVYAFIRTSPNTENDGLFQKIFIIAGCMYLIKHGLLPEFDTKRGIKFHEGEGVSRADVYESEAFQELVDAILVSTTSLDLIGVDEEKINQIIEKLLSLHPKILFISMNEFGVDPFVASNRVGASYHNGWEQIVKTICNHIGLPLSYTQKNVNTDEGLENRIWKICQYQCWWHWQFW